MKLQDSLVNWGGIVCNVVTDEEIGDIKLAIKYEDHGDEFLYVKTYSGEEYEYGYYLNRYGYSDFDPARNNGEPDEEFIRRPILFKIPDKRSSLSNDIFQKLRSSFCGIQEHMDFGPQKYNDAEWRIEKLLTYIEELLSKNNDTMYHFEDYRKDIVSFIEINDLDKKWIKKVNSIAWNSRVNGFDGIAGKKKSYGYLTGDCAIKVLYKGRDFDITKLTYRTMGYDECGCSTYGLNPNQFA